MGSPSEQPGSSPLMGGYSVRGFRSGPRGFKVLFVLVLCTSPCMCFVSVRWKRLIVVVVISFWSTFQREGVQLPHSKDETSLASADVDSDVDTSAVDMAEPTLKYTDKIDPEQFEEKLRGGAPAFPISTFVLWEVFVDGRHRRHRRMLTVATMFRNQRRWLREWIEFYRIMGAEQFILYDNNSTDLPREVLQPYIDDGLVLYFQWPPAQVPAPHSKFATKLDEWQYQWFKDCLETCIADDWIIHKQVPCQLAAFADAITRAKGQSRWIGIFDVDEYIFARPSGNFTSLVELLQHHHGETDHLRVVGNTFGTSGFVEHAPQRKEGDKLHPLMTENYIMRAPLNHDDHPYAHKEGATYEVQGKGLLGKVTFGAASEYIIKHFSDPAMISHCYIHGCFHQNSTGPDWPSNNEQIWVDNDFWKFNHYPFLSLSDVKRKGDANKNPYIGGYDNGNMDEFFSKERDTEIWHFLPQLKERMMRGIKERPPRHPDDWVPPQKD